MGRAQCAFHRECVALVWQFECITSYQRRGIGNAEGEAGADAVGEEAFHRAADLTLGQLFAKMEAFAQEHTDPPATVDMTQGTLRIQSESGGIQVGAGCLCLSVYPVCLGWSGAAMALECKPPAIFAACRSLMSYCC